MADVLNSNIIKINDVRNFLTANVNLQLNEKWAPRIYIQGAPGCGKSYILRDICAENGWALKTFFISNSALEMLTGLPCKVENGEGAKWTKPEILDMSIDKLEYVPEDYKAGVTPTILLLDDFHLCDRMMQKYCFQLFTEMGLNGYKLPDKTAIIIAGNRAQDKAGAMPIPAPVCNRMMFVEVTSEAKDWIENFAIKHNVRNDIISFINNKGDVFLSQSPIESTAWASPRAWTYLSSQMDAYEKALGKLDLHNLMVMANGLIGSEYAKEFVMYRELFAAWDFDKLIKSDWTKVKAEIKSACNKNPTSVYAITMADLTWCINKYKELNYQADDETFKKVIKFSYDVLAYLLVMKCHNVTARPLVAAGLSYVQLYENTLTTKMHVTKYTSIVDLFIDTMNANSQKIDYIFLDMIYEIFNIPRDMNDPDDVADLKKINEAKAELENGTLDI